MTLANNIEIRDQTVQKHLYLFNLVWCHILYSEDKSHFLLD